MKEKKNKQTKIKSVVKNPDMSAKVFQDSDGEKHVVLVEQKEYFIFRNLLPGAFYFIREDGSDGKIVGEGILDNITVKERKMLLKSTSFKIGQIVEETEEETAEEESNLNSLSDYKLKRLFQEHGKDIDYLKKYIINMDSLFAVRRIKKYIVDNDYSATLSSYCDSKIIELEEEYLEGFKEPISKVPSGI